VLDVAGCGGSGGTGSLGPVDGGGDGTMLTNADGSMTSGDDGSSSSSGGSSGSSSGGSSGSSSGGSDAETDDANTADTGLASDASSSSDADAGASSSSGGGDAGSDAGDGAVSIADGTPCVVSGANGYYLGQVCINCDSGGSSVGPDTNCTNDYGGGTVPYVCATGSCIPGNCNADTDCTTAPNVKCGFSMPNVCGGCTEDSQCSGQVCDTTASDTNYGKCVAATGGCAVAATDSPCPLNTSDVCCAGSCYTGNCCTAVATYCNGVTAGTACKAAAGAISGVCSLCTAVTGSSPVYYVDPVHGSDSGGTGDNTGNLACAFRSITRALQVIGASPSLNTTINVVNSAVGGGVLTVPFPGGVAESFPIILPTNVTLETSTTVAGTNGITIEVPAAATGKQTAGIVLSGSPSGINGGALAPLTIDGKTKTATYGVVVDSTSATLSNVTIANFAGDGIAVNNSGNAASMLTINAGTTGVQSNNNGQDGLGIAGASSVTINAGAASAAIAFNNNLHHGILLTGTAGITITGGSIGATPPSSGNIILSGNAQAGIWIQSTPSAQSLLSGVVCTASTNGNGLRIIPGANVKVRNSWFLGNSSGSGIDIENARGSAGTSIANINLGTDGDYGDNVVQAPSGGSVNLNSGICLLIAAGADVQLNAQGNIFGGTSTTAVNCGVTGTNVLRVANALTCTGHSDVGGTIIHFPTDGGAGNTINVTASHCSY
jgi:hypothetical protein